MTSPTTFKIKLNIAWHKWLSRSQQHIPMPLSPNLPYQTPKLILPVWLFDGNFLCFSWKIIIEMSF